MDYRPMENVDDNWPKDKLYAECKRRQIGGCARLNKAGLIRKLRHGPTVDDLKAMCRNLGLRGYGSLKKAGLISLLEGTGVVEPEVPSPPNPTPRPNLGQLQPIAQKAFDDGPTDKDKPGVVYVYFEIGGIENEWKVGRTTQDPPNRRMYDAARKNKTTYKLKKSWPVRFNGFAEKVVHAELNGYKVPRKQKAGGGEWADGGNEWYKVDYAALERTILLVRRMIAVHYR